MMLARLILAPLVALMLVTPAVAEKLSLSEISNYINGLTTAETEFSQENADGSRSAGRLFIKRPNRMRFEYDGKNAALVLASGGQVAIFDAKSNLPPDQYPLRRTPLNLILGQKVDLTRARMVVGHDQEGALTTVTAQDPEHPEYGTIKLMFSEAPIALRAWIVTDEGGGQTTVTLGDLNLGASYSVSMFSIDDEIEKRGIR